MHRTLAVAIALSLGSAPAACAQERPAPAARQPAREMAVTFDDLPVASVLGRDLAMQQRVTAGLLEAIRRHRVPAVGFVNEDKLEQGGRVEPARVALLRRWLDAGVELGNHTYSHPDLHRVAPADFRADVLRGERVTRPLADSAGRPLRWFRHPFLHTGRDTAVRRGLESFLAERGYRVAPVTVDNHDYLFAAAYDRAGARGDREAQRRVVDAYLDYMLRVVAYSEQQSQALFGRNVRHVLLLHANALNAAAFDALARRLRDRGYAFVTLDRALADPAYASPDAYAGPAGITWLHRWALTRGERGAFFAGEPEVPQWVRTAAAPPGR